MTKVTTSGERVKSFIQYKHYPPQEHRGQAHRFLEKKNITTLFGQCFLRARVMHGHTCIIYTWTVVITVIYTVDSHYLEIQGTL